MGVYFTVTKRCIRCRQPERNDGTKESPIWVCDNPKCVRHKPKPKYTSADTEGGVEAGAGNARVQTGEAGTAERENTAER